MERASRKLQTPTHNDSEGGGPERSITKSCCVPLWDLKKMPEQIYREITKDICVSPKIRRIKQIRRQDKLADDCILRPNKIPPNFTIPLRRSPEKYKLPVEPGCKLIHLPGHQVDLRKWFDGIADTWLQNCCPDEITSTVPSIDGHPCSSFVSCFPLEIQTSLHRLITFDKLYSKNVALYPDVHDLEEIVKSNDLKAVSRTGVEKHGGYILIQSDAIRRFIRRKKIVDIEFVHYGTFVNSRELKLSHFSSIFHASTMYLVHHSALMDKQMCFLVRKCSRLNERQPHHAVLLFPQKTLEFCLNMFFQAKHDDPLYSVLGTNLNYIARYCKRKDTCFNIPVKDIGPHLNMDDFIESLKICHDLLNFAYRRAFVLCGDGVFQQKYQNSYYKVFSVDMSLKLHHK